MTEKFKNLGLNDRSDIEQLLDHLVARVCDAKAKANCEIELSWDENRLLTRSEAPRLARAKGYPLSIWQLERLAVTGGGPPITYFNKKPLYRVRDLKAWLASRTREAQSTAELKRTNNVKRRGQP